MYSSRPPKRLNNAFLFCGFVGVVFQIFHLVPVPNSAQTLDMDQSLLSTVLKCCDARSVLLFHLKDVSPLFLEV